MSYVIRPLDGRQRRDYRPIRSPFDSAWGATTMLLEREVGYLRTRDQARQPWVLQRDVREQDLRLDGGLRANAREPQTPTVVVSFDSKHGPMRYECGRFSKWQDNVRAIALGLEALRKVDRYGIGGSGEQYRGWQALPPAQAMGAGWSKHDAARILCDLSGEDCDAGDVIVDEDGGIDEAYVEVLFRAAAKLHHPDVGGDPNLFANAQRARDTLLA